jgi:hypothetical protein
MKRSPLILLLSLLLLGLASSCLPEKEVEIELPPYERQLVVECFLEPGKNLRLLLMESVGFTEGPDTPLVEDAIVIISHHGIQDTLAETFSFEPIGFKFFNYNSTFIVPQDYDEVYELHIKTPDGRELNGSTKVYAPVQLEPLELSFDQDSMASITLRWWDVMGTSNYYLCALHRGTLYNADEEYEGGLEFDFVLDDRIGDGELFTIATLFDFKHGDTLIGSLYQIGEDYWRYVNSVDDAASSNGNPFAQPGMLQSNVQGGIGVFTGFEVVRDTIIVP